MRRANDNVRAHKQQTRNKRASSVFLMIMENSILKICYTEVIFIDYVHSSTEKKTLGLEIN